MTVATPDDHDTSRQRSPCDSFFESSGRIGVMVIGGTPRTFCFYDLFSAPHMRS